MKDYDRDILIAADVLVERALHKTGKWIVRKSRDRAGIMRDRKTSEAHMLWPLRDEHRIESLISDAWDYLEVLEWRYGWTPGTAEQLTRTLNVYTRDLLVTGTRHNIADLAYRLEDKVGLDIGWEGSNVERLQQTG